MPVTRLPIQGFEGRYDITSDGRVWSYKSKRWLKATPRKGYPRVTLCHKDGTKTTRTVHRFVGIHFAPNPFNKPCINHKDGNKANNDYRNLEWCTWLENIHHAKVNGYYRPVRGEANSKAKLTTVDVEEIHRSELSRRRLGEIYGVHPGTIDKIKRGAMWRHMLPQDLGAK